MKHLFRLLSLLIRFLTHNLPRAQATMIRTTLSSSTADNTLVNIIKAINSSQ
jgi:hypothetical protein